VRAACSAIAVAGAIALAGCGDDNQAKPASSGLSKAELVAKANAICKPHYEKITVAAQKLLAGGKLPSPRKFGELAMGTIIPEYRAQLAQLHALKPADEIAAQYAAWLATSDATLVKMQKSPRLITSADNFKTVNGQADALGLSEQCHVGPGG
jgi:hypothetical protein